MDATKAIEIIDELRERLNSHVSIEKEIIEALDMAINTLRSDSIGEWNIVVDHNNMCYYECSICGGRSLRNYFGIVELSDRCPHCGARMEE